MLGTSHKGIAPSWYPTCFPVPYSSNTSAFDSRLTFNYYENNCLAQDYHRHDPLRLPC